MPTGIYNHKSPSKGTRKRMSKAHRGTCHSEESKKKMSKIAKRKGFGKWMIGKELSDETKEKMSISSKGKPNKFKGIPQHSEKTKEKMSKTRMNRKRKLGYLNSIEARKKMSSSKKGRKLSKETRIKMSNAQKGEKGSNWKDGITPENKKIRNSIEARLWRESVFARDGYTCQKTRIKGGQIEAHHIHNFADFPELRFAIDNGTTLSKKEHKEFHKKYGKKNNTKEQLEEFLLK